MRRRKGNSKEKLILVVGLVMTLILGYRGYQAGWFENIDMDNLGAVGSTTFSPPVVKVISVPSFELKYNENGSENNLVIKADYSLTAKDKGVYIPTEDEVFEVKSSSGKLAFPSKISITSLDPVGISSNCLRGNCYFVPAGKTIRFRAREVFDSLSLSSDTYVGKLRSVTYSHESAYNPYYSSVSFPDLTSKLTSIEVVGTKAPYLYTSSATVASGYPLKLKGERFSGAIPVAVGVGPIPTFNTSNFDSVLDINLPPGTYKVYLNHPVYGPSNKVSVTVTPSVASSIKITEPNGGERWALGGNQKAILTSSGLNTSMKTCMKLTRGIIEGEPLPYIIRTLLTVNPLTIEFPTLGKLSTPSGSITITPGDYRFKIFLIPDSTDCANPPKIYTSDISDATFEIYKP